MLTDGNNSEQIAGGTTTMENNQDRIVKKMLIAIDDSEHKDKIISYGLSIAKSLGADVTATHVIDRASVAGLSDMGDLEGYFAGGNRPYEEELIKHAKELLGEVDALAKKLGMKINIHIIINVKSVAEGILDYASSTNMDLIVIGTKGKTGGHRFLVGGNSNKIIDHAHCPVLAVR
jgi:nucleotide-binding universal stress UspA family protein